MKSTRFEVNRDYSLVFNAIELSDLGPYICQAYSGLGKPVSMYVTLKAIGPVYANTPEDEPYLKYILDAPPLQPTETYYRSTPPVDLTPVGKFIEASMVWDFSIKFFSNNITAAVLFLSYFLARFCGTVCKTQTNQFYLNYLSILLK